MKKYQNCGAPLAFGGGGAHGELREVSMGVIDWW